MALIRKPSPPKGSTVIIVFMYATWCAYIAVQIWCKTAVNASKLGISGLEDFEEEVKAAQAAGKDSQ